MHHPHLFTMPTAATSLLLYDALHATSPLRLHSAAPPGSRRPTAFVAPSPLAAAAGSLQRQARCAGDSAVGHPLPPVGVLRRGGALGGRGLRGSRGSGPHHCAYNKALRSSSSRTLLAPRGRTAASDMLNRILHYPSQQKLRRRPRSALPVTGASPPVLEVHDLGKPPRI